MPTLPAPLIALIEALKGGENASIDPNLAGLILPGISGQMPNIPGATPPTLPTQPAQPRTKISMVGDILKQILPLAATAGLGAWAGQGHRGGGGRGALEALGGYVGQQNVQAKQKQEAENLNFERAMQILRERRSGRQAEREEELFPLQKKQIEADIEARKLKPQIVTTPSGSVTNIIGPDGKVMNTIRGGDKLNFRDLAPGHEAVILDEDGNEIGRIKSSQQPEARPRHPITFARKPGGASPPEPGLQDPVTGAIYDQTGQVVPGAVSYREPKSVLGELTPAMAGAAGKLADDFRQDTKDFVIVRDAYDRIGASASDPSAAGDLSLIFAYMKLLDPTSTVREGEQATAQNTGSVPQQIAASYNKVLSGQRFTPEQRADFAARAKKLYSAKEGRYQQVKNVYSARAKKLGIPEDLVIMDLTTGGAQKPAGATETVRMRAPNGEEKDVPIDQVKHYESKGARVVGK